MQFQKGQSGNLAGRPRGSRNKASLRMQEMLEQRAEELVNKLVAMAIAGNIGALRLCLDRLVPARRDEPTRTMRTSSFAGSGDCDVRSRDFLLRPCSAPVISAGFPGLRAVCRFLHPPAPIYRDLQGLLCESHSGYEPL
jgi:hypothetical protein